MDIRGEDMSEVVDLWNVSGVSLVNKAIGETGSEHGGNIAIEN